MVINHDVATVKVAGQMNFTDDGRWQQVQLIKAVWLWAMS